jgi:SAM-dependent methyltransferase
MLSMAKVTATDYVIDLGSGDGRLVREAARRYGARGLGVERDPGLVARSLELARQDGVAGKVTFVAQDLFETDIRAASVVTLYLLPEVNAKLRPRLLANLRPGTRVVSHDFDMGDWAPDEVAEVQSSDKFGEGGDSTIYLWIVPADLSGRWKWRLEAAGQSIDYELEVAQRLQKVEGSARVAGSVQKVEQFSLRGDAVSFVLVAEIKGSTVRQHYSGRVRGETLEGSVVLSGVRLQGQADWTAVRSQRSTGSAQRASSAVARRTSTIIFAASTAANAR